MGGRGLNAVGYRRMGWVVDGCLLFLMLCMVGSEEFHQNDGKMEKVPIERLLQMELCKLYSSDFEEVTRSELTPFLAVMQLVKAQYAIPKPEVYKTIIAVLHDYNPNLGELHRTKTVRYVRTLLDSSPELADFVVDILPKPMSNYGISKPRVSNSNIPVENMQETRTLKRPGQTIIDPKEIPKKKKLPYYNYTPPVVSAYVASQGIPPKVTSIINTSSIQTMSQIHPVTLSVSRSSFPIMAVSAIGNHSLMGPSSNTPSNNFGTRKIIFRKDMEKQTKDGVFTPVGIMSKPDSICNSTSSGSLTCMTAICNETMNSHNLGTIQVMNSLNEKLLGKKSITLTSEKTVDQKDKNSKKKNLILLNKNLKSVAKLGANNSGGTGNAKLPSPEQVIAKYLQSRDAFYQKYFSKDSKAITASGSGSALKITTSSGSALVSNSKTPEPVLVIPGAGSNSIHRLSDINLSRGNAPFPYQQRLKLANGTEQNINVNPSEEMISMTSKESSKSIVKKRKGPSIIKDHNGALDLSGSCTNGPAKALPRSDFPQNITLSSEDEIKLLDEQPLDLSSKTSLSGSPASSGGTGIGMDIFSIIDDEINQVSPKLRVPGDLNDLVNNSEHANTNQTLVGVDNCNQRGSEPIRKDEAVSNESSLACPLPLTEDELEEMVLLSQIDGTSDHGDFMNSENELSPTFNMLSSPDGSRSKNTPDIADSLSMNTEAVIHPQKITQENKSHQDTVSTPPIYSSYTQNSVTHQGYLSRLVNPVSPPPNITPYWSFLEEQPKRSKARRKQKNK